MVSMPSSFCKISFAVILALFSLAGLRTNRKVFSASDHDRGSMRKWLLFGHCYQTSVSVLEILLGSDWR